MELAMAISFVEGKVADIVVAVLVDLSAKTVPFECVWVNLTFVRGILTWVKAEYSAEDKITGLLLSQF